ncbi:MAG: YhcH/YjgK/YiaL family protein [Gallionella sp.]
MILATLALAPRYSPLHPLFPQAFAYLRDTDLNALSVGVHEIVGRQLFIIVEEANGRTRTEAKLEAHRKYIDIQLVLAGDESMGWRALADCHQPIDEHNEKRDICFFEDAPVSWIVVPPAHFCIFFPDDAHAPLVGKGAIRKVIMKIAVDAL